MRCNCPQYALFSFDSYYPYGGASDLRKLFKTNELDQIEDFIRDNADELDEKYQVYDLIAESTLYYGELDEFLKTGKLNNRYFVLERMIEDE